MRELIEMSTTVAYQTRIFFLFFLVKKTHITHSNGTATTTELKKKKK